MVNDTFHRYSPRNNHNTKAEALHNVRGTVYTYRMETIMVSTSSAAEIINGYTSIFGTSAASSAIVDIVSSSAEDDSRLGASSQAATAVKIFGIDTAYNYVVEEVATTGASNASTTTEWSRLIGMWISDCGGGNSYGTGNITCHNTGSTSFTFMTIATTTIGTSSMALWVAPNWEIHVDEVTAMVNSDSAVATAGSRFFIDYDDQQGVAYEPTLKSSVYPTSILQTAKAFHKHFLPTVEPAVITWIQQSNASASVTTVSYGVDYIIYPVKESLSSSQYDYISKVEI